MFERLKIKNRHFIKSGDIKKFQQRIQTIFPKSSNLFEKNDTIETGILEDGTTLYLINGELYFFEMEGYTIPFLRVLLKNLIQLPKVVIDQGAVSFIARGADVMNPGIVATDENIKVGDYVVVVDEKHGKPLAIGVVLIERSEITREKKGKAVKNLHYVGDPMWEFGKNLEGK